MGILTWNSTTKNDILQYTKPISKYYFDGEFNFYINLCQHQYFFFSTRNVVKLLVCFAVESTVAV